MGGVNDVVWESVVHPTCLCIPCRLGSLQFKGQGYLRELGFSILSLPHKGLMKKEAGGKCCCFSSLGWGSCSLLLSVSYQFCHYSKKGKILKLSSWSQGTAGVIQTLWALWLALVSYCFVTGTNIIVWFFREGLGLYFWEGCICFFLTLMCIPWLLYWIAGYREQNHSECGCKDEITAWCSPGMQGEVGHNGFMGWSSTGGILSEDRGLCHMEWFRQGEETKEFSQKSSAGIVFKSSFLFSLVLGNYMVNQYKLLPPNAVASCCVFVGILLFWISMPLSTLMQGCLATQFPVVFDRLVRIGLSVS